MSLASRFFGWLGDRVFDAMGARLEGLNAPAEPARERVAEDVVEPRPDDEGLLGPEAASMVAPAQPSAEPKPPEPLEGSAAARFGHLRLR